MTGRTPMAISAAFIAAAFMAFAQLAPHAKQRLLVIGEEKGYRARIGIARHGDIGRLSRERGE